MNKEVIILRGIPGAGKSTLAELINGVICTADDYFVKNGVYTFDSSKLHLAHEDCMAKFTAALEAGESRIIVANTSTRQRDVLSYKMKAEKYGYKVFVMTVENWHGSDSVHNVPNESRIKMAEQLKNSIKLI